jgi:apolipoprotein D and lipocalin family protein
MRVLFCSVFLVGCAATLAPPSVVSSYAVGSYAGSWYQIADYPQFYEKSCNQCVQAEYTVNPDKSIKVDNSCRKTPSSGVTTVHAKAVIKDPSEPAKLTVTFFHLFPAPYWIIALGPKNSDNKYSWALVSNGLRESCYILSRTPTITDDEKDMIFEAMAKNQISNSTDKLKFTTQEGCWQKGAMKAEQVEQKEAELVAQLNETRQLKSALKSRNRVGGPLHASCKMTFQFASTSCPDVINALSVSAKKMHGLDVCGQNPPDSYCGYTETGRSANSWKGTHQTRNGKYTDDLTFTMSASGSGCSAAAYSTSETWYAVLDNSVNYCNLHNLVDKSGLSYTETDVSDSTCTQYSKRNCGRY